MKVSWKTRFLAVLIPLIAPAASVLAQVPEGDLTITVQELAGGEVQFTASGTAFMQHFGGFSTTPATNVPLSPPHQLTVGGTFPLPPGMILTVPEAFTSEEEPSEGPENAAPGFIDLSIDSIVFESAGPWFLGEWESPFLPISSTITGSGSVTTNDIPFSNFVPGVYKIAAEQPKAQSFTFVITYRVLALEKTAAPPRLSVATPSAFPRTEVDRSSRSQRVRITNTGKVPVTGIVARSAGKHSSDFETEELGAKTLAPGASTSVKVTFRPKARGARRAMLSVRSTAPAKSVPLLGFGLENPPNSPRFPRGFP